MPTKEVYEREKNTTVSFSVHTYEGDQEDSIEIKGQVIKIKEVEKKKKNNKFRRKYGKYTYFTFTFFSCLFRLRLHSFWRIGCWKITDQNVGKSMLAVP